MDRHFILSEIQRTSVDGRGLGQIRFANETGIKSSDWLGKYWARWGDALREAGLAQNEWNAAYEEQHVLASLLQLTRKLGKFPTKYELNLAQKSDATVPGYKAVVRLCSRPELKNKLLQFCREHREYQDIESIIESLPVSGKLSGEFAEFDTSGNSSSNGYVYLIRAQAVFKIGSTRAPYRRASEIANQSASGAELIHLISTDDPEGIEDYWHRRFSAKRIAGINKQGGEWFSLISDDVKAFKRRKSM